MKKPEEQARETIDAALTAAGWDIQDAPRANVHAARGVAIREFPLKTGYGFADYLLYVDGKAAGIALIPQDPNDEPASVLLERIRQARAAEDEARPRMRGRQKMENPGKSRKLRPRGVGD